MIVDSNNVPYVRYRVYADGNVLHQDDFEEQDNSLPYYDDYEQHCIPVVLDEYIRSAIWQGKS